MKRLWAFLSLAILALTATVRAEVLTFHLSTGLSGQNVFFASDITNWGSEAVRMNETEPGQYAIQIQSPWLHELQYKFIVEGRWIDDPLNPNQAPDGLGGINSWMAVNFQEDPMLTLQPGARAFERRDFYLTDFEEDSRPIIVLSPPRLRRSEKSLTLYFEDGLDYLNRTGISELLANLMAQGYPPMTAVLIPPKDRMREYKMAPAYAQFVAQRVVPEVERRFNTGGSRDRRLLIGPSLGGLVSAFIGLAYPDIFQLVASQSGSFWWEDGRLRPYVQAAAGKGMRFFVETGIYEGQEALQGNQRFAQELRAAGHDVRYEEYPSTHDWIAWRNRLRTILQHFFGPSR